MKKLLLAGLLVIVLVGLPATVILFQNRQEIRSRASASTVLFFTHNNVTTTPSNPITKNTGDTFSLNVMVDPGNNSVSTIKMRIRYDQTKFQAVGNSPFVVNNAAFPTTIEGPINDAAGGNIYVTVFVGIDPTKAIKSTSVDKRVGTLTLRAINQTDANPSIISFGSETQALSAGGSEQASENILATATPAYIEVVEVPTITPTPSRTPTPTPTETPTPTPTSVPQATRFNLTGLLHGIGESGDSANPTNHSFSNKNPQRQTRNVTVFVYNSNNQLVLTKTGTMNYDPDEGDFKGTVSMGMTLTSGNYIVKVKTDSFLTRRVGGFVNIVPSTQINLPAFSVVAGDANGDNKIDVLDYNMLTGCYSDFLPPTFCDSNKQLLTDFNDDSNVNQIDYNLFLREITVQTGD